MSFDVYLVGPDGAPLPVENHSEGGTYVLGGCDHAELSVTYNYSRVWQPLGFGLRDLDGRTAGDTVELLERLVEQLGTERDPDYWQATAGNAGHALAILLTWARANPEGRWMVL